MNAKEKFENFLDSLKDGKQDELIESVKKGLHACVESLWPPEHDESAEEEGYRPSGGEGEKPLVVRVQMDLNNEDTFESVIAKVAGIFAQEAEFNRECSIELTAINNSKVNPDYGFCHANGEFDEKGAKGLAEMIMDFGVSEALQKKFSNSDYAYDFLKDTGYHTEQSADGDTLTIDINFW